MSNLVVNVPEILKKLPPMCASRHPVTGQPVILCRGVTGQFEAPTLDVDQFNPDYDISPFQVQAMEIGSMLGWDVPGADPDYWQARAEGRSL